MEGMDTEERREMEAAHVIFAYIGPGKMPGVPARDLYADDLLDLEEREGIGREVLEVSPAYIPARFFEVEPFCGAPTADGGRCRRPVKEWGDRCFQHQQSVGDGEDVASSGLRPVSDHGSDESDKYEEVSDDVEGV